MNIDMTKGNILKNIILFSIPIFIGNILQQVYNLTDTWVAGKYLTDGISAIGASTSIYDLVLWFASGVTSGFAIGIAQAFGAKDEKRKKLTIWYTILLTLGLTLILTILALVFLKPLMHALNTPDEIFDLAYKYIFIILLGMITTMTYNMLQCMMRSAGNSFVALICLAVSVVLNVALDFLFVAGFNWGIAGAAWATVIAQGLSSVFCLIYIIKKMPELHVSKSDLSMNKKILKMMITAGLSMGFMHSIVGLGSLFQQSAINFLGQTYIDAHMLVRKVENIFMMPLSTIAATASTFAGQNYGAKKYYRIKKGLIDSIIFGMAWSLLSTIIMYPFGLYFVSWLGSVDINNKDIMNPAELHIMINIPMYAILTVLLTMRTTMQSVDFKILPVISSTIELVVKILVTYIFTKLWGYTAVIIGEPIIWTVCAIMLIITFVISKRGRTIMFAKESDENFSNE